MSWPRGLAEALVGLTVIAATWLLAVRITGAFDSFALCCLVLCGFFCVLTVWSWVGIILDRQRWDIRPGEVTSSVRMMSLGWSRTAEVEWLDRFELRRLPIRSGWSPVQFGYNEPDPGFELALVDLRDKDVAAMGPLTRGEALWMAGIIADVLKDALPKEGQTFARWSVSADEPAGGSKAMGDRWLDEAVYS